MMSPRSRGTVAALAAAALLLLAGCSTAPSERSLGQSSLRVEALKNAVEWVDVSLSAEELVPVASPIRITVPALDIDMSIEPHGLDAVGAMSLPESIFTAGWYQYGSAPANTEGSTVIAAHVDSREEGVGPFARLRSVAVGTEATVIDSVGVEHRYRVVSLEKLDEGEVPWEDYFTTVGTPRLILVTCGGEFIEELRNYTDNYIVTAEKVS